MAAARNAVCIGRRCWSGRPQTCAHTALSGATSFEGVRRIAVIEVSDNPRYPYKPPIPLTVIVNPLLQPVDNEIFAINEGCLSVPGLRGLVPRYRRLRYRGFDLHGAPIDRTVEGFHARVVQHEVDHLDGILFPQRVRDLRNFGFEDALAGQMTPMPD